MPTVFVMAPPAAHYLKHLERLPAEYDLVVSDRAEAFAARAAQAEIAIVAEPRGAPVLRELWPRLTNLQWVHAMLAGVEKVLFPELIASPIPLTNARGAYSKSLGEWAIAAMLYFAKDLPRLVRQKNAQHWEQFDLDELGRQTVGIIGYGDIGREVAKRAKAFGSRVIGLRRRPELSLEDPYLDL
nr:hypothetical protein [Bryobacter sp.]